MKNECNSRGDERKMDARMEKLDEKIDKQISLTEKIRSGNEQKLQTKWKTWKQI